MKLELFYDGNTLRIFTGCGDMIGEYSLPGYEPDSMPYEIRHAIMQYFMRKT